MPSSFIYLADLHVGEGCASSTRDYQRNDTDCYSVRRLNDTVARINEELDGASFVVVGGDLTSSAQASEFAAARSQLDRLRVPYFTMLGNHDIWSYDQVTGDRTASPRGDALFATTFGSTFRRLLSDYPGFRYSNQTSYSDRGDPRQYQSWSLRPRTADFGPDFDGVVLLAPDFNGRLKAPPPCPGHSPLGGCGVMGMADLNDDADGGGAWRWFEAELDGLAHARENASAILLTHQPFRCRPGVPDWYFCFSSSAKRRLRDAVARRALSPAVFWGQLAGHQHRFWSGAAFDEPPWAGFKQVEVSAVKGDAIDARMASAFLRVHVAQGVVHGVTRHWREGDEWRSGEA